MADALKHEDLKGIVDVLKLISYELDSVTKEKLFFVIRSLPKEDVTLSHLCLKLGSMPDMESVARTLKLFVGESHFQELFENAHSFDALLPNGLPTDN